MSYGIVRWFPERVWEPTGVDEEGRTLWSGRTATKEDHERRRELAGRLFKDTRPAP